MAESLTAFFASPASSLDRVCAIGKTPSGRLAIQLGAWIGFAALARAESLLLLVLLVVHPDGDLEPSSLARTGTKAVSYKRRC